MNGWIVNWYLRLSRIRLRSWRYWIINWIIIPSSIFIRCMHGKNRVIKVKNWILKGCFWWICVCLSWVYFSIEGLILLSVCIIMVKIGWVSVIRVYLLVWNGWYKEMEIIFNGWVGIYIEELNLNLLIDLIFNITIILYIYLNLYWDL